MTNEKSSNPEGREDLHEFFAKDPIAADRAFFGRESCSGRRGFLRGAGLATMAAMVGAAIPFHRNMPAGLIPAAFADEDVLAGKDGLTLLNVRPVNAETPPHLLDDAITPTARHFIPQQRDSAGRGGCGGVDPHRRRPRRPAHDVLDRRPSLEVRGGHHGPCDRVRGQRAGVLRPAREGQPVDLGSGRVLAVDRSALAGRARGGRGPAGGGLYRPRRRRRRPLRQARQAPHLPRGADSRRR